MTGEMCNLILGVPLTRKVYVCVCAGRLIRPPPVRVMIKALWADVLSRRTISRALRDGNARRSRRVGSDQGDPREVLRSVAGVFSNKPPAGGH